MNTKPLTQYDHRAAWADARPPAMATLLDQVSKHWDTGAGIEMWDDE
jgi:hypothetical protein